MSEYTVVADFLEKILYRYGLVGVFIVSLISNAVPYLTVPYLIVIALYSSLIREEIYRVMIVIFSALGASLGKIVVYLIGYSFRHIVSENTRKNIDVLRKYLGKSTFITILVFASLPLPDDIVCLPIGVLKYDLARFFIALFLGKLIVSSVTIYYGSLASILIESFGELPYYVSIPILILITIYVSYVVVNLNWIYLISSLREKGFFKFICILLREIYRITTSIFKKIYVSIASLLK